MDKIKTVWDVILYGTSGNAQTGWDVEDWFTLKTVELEAEVKACADGGYEISLTPQQVCAAMLLVGRESQTLTVTDTECIYVHEAATSYPFGELRCTSHTKLFARSASALKRSRKQPQTDKA